jgi:hypothetical protein
MTDKTQFPPKTAIPNAPSISVQNKEGIENINITSGYWILIPKI